MKKGIVLCSITIFLLSACMETENVQPSTNQDAVQHVKDSQPTPLKEGVSNNEIAEHLAGIATRVPDVNEATAIIAGPYAIVAIDVESTKERDRVGTIKYSVSEALYKDPYGKTAVVIADGDLIERFQQMGSKMNDGFPIQGVVDELAAIVGRYMPVLPTNENAPKTKTNDDDMTDEEESDFDDIQKEQSKGDQYE